MKKITPNYAKLVEESIMFAYLKGKPKEIFPVYYQGYDNNWDEQQWADGEGETYSDTQLVFVDTDDWRKENQRLKNTKNR